MLLLPCGKTKQKEASRASSPQQLCGQNSVVAANTQDKQPKTERFRWDDGSEVSVHGSVGLLALGLEWTLRREPTAEQVCAPPGGWQAENKRKGLKSQCPLQGCNLSKLTCFL